MKWDGLSLIDRLCPREKSQEHKPRNWSQSFTHSHAFQSYVRFWDPRWHPSQLDLGVICKPSSFPCLLMESLILSTEFESLRLFRSPHYNVHPVPCPVIQVTIVVHTHLCVFISSKARICLDLVLFYPSLPWHSFFHAGNEIAQLCLCSNVFLHV